MSKNKKDSVCDPGGSVRSDPQRHPQSDKMPPIAFDVYKGSGSKPFSRLDIWDTKIILERGSTGAGDVAASQLTAPVQYDKVSCMISFSTDDHGNPTVSGKFNVKVRQTEKEPDDCGNKACIEWKGVDAFEITVPED